MRRFHIVIFAITALCLSAPAFGQFAVDVSIATPPSIHATGESVTERPSIEQLGELLSYPNSDMRGIHNIKTRAYASSPCRNYNPQMPVTEAVREFTGDVYGQESLFYASLADVPPQYQAQYQETGAKPVERVVKSVFSRIIDQDYQIEQADSDVCDNNSGADPITCTESLTATTTDTTTVTTTDSNAYNAAVDFTFKVREGTSSSPVGLEQGLQAHFGYTKTQSTAQAVTHTQTKTHAETVAVTVPPGQATEVEMVVQTGNIHGEVEYAEMWRGDVVHHCLGNQNMVVLDLHSLYSDHLDVFPQGGGISRSEKRLPSWGEIYNQIKPRQLDNHAFTSTYHIDGHVSVTTENHPVRIR